MPKTGATQIETWRGKSWEQYVADLVSWWDRTTVYKLAAEKMIAHQVWELEHQLAMAAGAVDSCKAELAFIERNRGTSVIDRTPRFVPSGGE